MLSSVGARFRRQLGGLMAALGQCQPHYIRWVGVPCCGGVGTCVLVGECGLSGGAGGVMWRSGWVR